MLWFNRREREEKSKTVRPPIEMLETRTLFSTAATVVATVPGPIPGPTIAGVVVHDKIGVNIANNDVVHARGRATIALFISTDNVLSSDDAQIQTPKSYPLNIAPGHNRTIKINVKSFPQNLNGSYYILAQVTGSAVNPVTAASTTLITVEQPEKDLAGVVVHAPAHGHAGHRIPVRVQVTNDGNILAHGKLAVAFALSASQDGSSPTGLGSLTRPINLKPGKSVMLNFSVPLALGVPTGNEYVVATVDPSNAFLDPNLSNNTSTDQTPIIIT
jgi:hypothetical protein